jgi:hypothetical protein
LITRLEKIKETFTCNSDKNTFNKSLNFNQFSTSNPMNPKINNKTFQIKTNDNKIISNNNDPLKSTNFKSNFVNQRISPKSEKTKNKSSQKIPNINLDQTDIGLF